MTTKTNSRPLNMDEKKKFESIVHTDIDKAIQEYRGKKAERIEVVTKKLENNTEALKLLAKWEVATATVKQVEKDLKKLSVSVYTGGNYGDEDKKPRLRAEYNNYGNNNITEYKDIEKEFDTTIKKMEGMKRDYTLKLFGGDTSEALELFESLRKELEALTK